MRYSAQGDTTMADHTAALIDRLVQFVVGFIVPGGVVLFACATGSDTVRGWFEGAQNGPTFVGFAFVLLGALALGLVVMAIRFCVFEVIPWTGRPIVPAPTPINEAARAQHVETYADLRRSHYDFYLAGANLSVAIPFGIVIWKLVASDPITWAHLLGVGGAGVVASLALAVGAIEAITRYDAKRLRLVGPAA